MFPAALFMLAQQQAESFEIPTFFYPVVLLLLAGGALGWLVAAVLGFARARAFGASARWFTYAAVCLLIYHLQFFLLALRPQQALAIGAFFNLFVMLASICAIIGFVRLTTPQ
jgi:hypothetical protein